MKNTLFAFLFLITGCINPIAQAQSITGNFAGQQPGLNSSISLKANDQSLTGNFELNGRPGTVQASINGNTLQGNLYDVQMKKNYAFTGYLQQDSLYLSIVFPELNNHVVQLQMIRLPKPAAAGNSNLPAGKRNPALVGLWRYTETFSSGSGDSYSSFSTDYFMEFKTDGTVFSWTGKSAGGSNNLTIEGYPSDTQKAGWNTEGKTLILTDLATGQKSSLLFYAEPNRMMLHNGGAEKKIMTRLR